MNQVDGLLSLFRKKKKVGLALGGGAARGIAHIGILKVFKKHKIPVHFLAGTSAGSLIGVLYAAGMEPEAMEEAAKRLGWFRFVKIVLAKHGPASTEEIKKFIVKNIGNLKFSDLNIPFAVVATDLKTGREVILREGHVADAVTASVSFPGFFIPQKVGPDLLVDGGIADNVPSGVARAMGADFVIAVDAVPSKPIENDPDNAMQILGRAFDLVMHKISREGRELADILIEPDFPEDIWHIDVDKAPRLIKVGEEAAESRILEIKTRLFI